MARLAVLAAFLSAAGRAQADPPVLGVGLEGGGWPKIAWFGAAFEADEYVARHVAIHVHARWQGFSESDNDGCNYDFSGHQLDATLGIRLDARELTDARWFHPFLTASVGAGAERVRDGCPTSRVSWRGSPVGAVVAGFDLRDDIVKRAVFRFELRATAADFVSGPNAPFQLGAFASAQSFNQEVSIAGLYIVEL